LKIHRAHIQIANDSYQTKQALVTSTTENVALTNLYNQVDESQVESYSNSEEEIKHGRFHTTTDDKTSG